MASVAPLSDSFKGSDSRLGRQLVLDELFDLTLYRSLRKIGGQELRKTLDELIEVEVRHFNFWQEFFDLRLTRLNPGRALKLRVIMLLCRVFGAPAIDLVLEAIEVYGVRKYLTLWESYRKHPLGPALREILEDEFKHEDMVVTRLKDRIINPDRVRNIFLGLNDGMVEILGAVSGFFASFGQNTLVLVAGLTTAVAGALSMAAGAYVAASSENEMRRTQGEKIRFLDEEAEVHDQKESAVFSAFTVGSGYFVGAAFPLLPVLFGAKNALWSILTGGSTVLFVSMVLAFLSGMDAKKRALTNLILIAAAVAITYGIGTLVRIVWDVRL